MSPELTEKYWVCPWTATASQKEKVPKFSRPLLLPANQLHCLKLLAYGSAKCIIKIVLRLLVGVATFAKYGQER